MGSGCSKLTQTGQQDIKEPIRKPVQVIKRKRIQPLIVNQNQNEQLQQERIQQKYKIGLYLFQSCDQIEEALQMENWLQMLHQGQNLTKKHNQDYFQNETQQYIYRFYQQYEQQLQNFLFNYVPNKVRWHLWKVIMFHQQEYDPELYEILQTQQIAQKQHETIMKDLNRTYPNELYFKNHEQDLNNLKLGQKQLYRILKAISMYFPAVGYTQGMNLIIGFLLLVSGGKEQEVFWSFVYLGKRDLYQILGFFEDDFPLIYLYIYIFYEMLRKINKKIYDHVKNINLPDESWIFKWISTLLLYSFPLDFVVKAWDLILSRDLFFVLNICIGILISFQKIILDLYEIDFFLFFKNLKDDQDSYNEHYQTLHNSLNIAKKIELTQQQISNFSEKYLNIEKLKELQDKKKKNHYYTQYFKTYSKSNKKNRFIQSLIPSQNQNNINQIS